VQVGRDRKAEPLGDGTFVDLFRFDLLLDEWEASARSGESSLATLVEGGDPPDRASGLLVPPVEAASSQPFVA
jgi:hypothetical protein